MRHGVGHGQHNAGMSLVTRPDSVVPAGTMIKIDRRCSNQSGIREVIILLEDGQWRDFAQSHVE